MTRAETTFTAMGAGAHVRLESALIDGRALHVLAAAARERIAAIERALTRFDPGSELSRLNADPRPSVPASPVVRALARAIRHAGRRTGGLVDCTLLGEIVAAGYGSSRAGLAPAPLQAALDAAPPRAPARPSPAARYATVDAGARLVTRPPGVRLDSGGLGKGLTADLVASELPEGIRYAISCGGDLAVGGASADAPWEVAVTGARDGREAHRIRVRAGGVATSGIQARLWQTPEGGYAHHVLDPATGRPAWTGLVAVTAVADSALEAEIDAKAALLAGPAAAREALRRAGGVLQHDDGRIEVVPPARVVRLRRPARDAVSA